MGQALKTKPRQGPSSTSRARPEVLVEQFAENVAAQTDAIWRGDAKAGFVLTPPDPKANC
jgi:hypothetical protein